MTRAPRIIPTMFRAAVDAAASKVWPLADRLEGSLDSGA
jgi:hypothetical protein